jgi:hypothetical protein
MPPWCRHVSTQDAGAGKQPASDSLIVPALPTPTHTQTHPRLQAEEEAARLRAALESGEKLDAASAATLICSLAADGGNEAVAAAMKKLNVEGGLAGKMRALYDGLFASDTKVGCRRRCSAGGLPQPPPPPPRWKNAGACIMRELCPAALLPGG